MAKKGIKEKLSKKVGEAIFSAQGLPIFLSLTVLSLSFVLFRMKSVELDYKITKKNRTIEKELNRNKELKAKKARLLSVKNLRKMASRHDLKEPSHKQIILIP